MKLILANPRGFCAGVHMAVDVVGILLDTCPEVPVYVYHEIVHNRHVVDRFVDRGAVFVENLEDVPHGSLVVFSAHGVSPAMRKLAESRALITVDATCPLVTKVHSEAVRYARQGYQILLVGHRNHQEVIGTMGEAPDATQVVESPADIPNLVIKDPARLVYLTQTTLSTDDAGVIIDALKRAFPLIKEPPGSDICYATTNRQAAVRQIAPECDLVLVVGSRNSSNSVRLTEIAENVGTRAFLLDDASELQDAWFRDTPGAGRDATVLVTAGASAPEDLVADLCRTLLKRYASADPARQGIEQRDIVSEDVEFGLPAALKRLMRDKGIDPEGRRIRVGNYQITETAYGAVPITVSAKD
ncbi:MAG TPA: 4-hydroxy-3-methylbut-2-enyl diphosphate reductase, partial [Phycisphaerales bacterium]|nr:4-hydroxy-3-methylbut-2-enyl diphosphate reductase [Phycisphaerales bacterium]